MRWIRFRSSRTSLAIAGAHRPRPRLTPRERESREFRRLVAVSLPAFLVLAALGKLTGWRWQPWPESREGRRSVFREARETAETCIALSFMGW